MKTKEVPKMPLFVSIQYPPTNAPNPKGKKTFEKKEYLKWEV